MQPVSAGFSAIVTQGHHRATRVTLLNADLTTDQELPVVEYGTVSIERERRSCSFTLANPGGAWTPAGPDDPLFPNRLIRIERGVYTVGLPEYVSLGIFAIDRPRIDVAGSEIAITGQDRLKFALRSSFTRPTYYDSGTGLGEVIRMIAQDAGMGSVFYRNLTTKTLAADRLFEVGHNRIDAIRQLATDYSLDVYVDADGFLVVEPAIVSESLPAPVWEFARGTDAIMLGLTKEFGDDRWYNHVLVIGEAADLEPVSAEARDLNPDSPGYNPPDGSGPIGDRLYTYASPMIRDEQMAQDVADAILLEVALVEEEIRMPSVVHPALEARDVVTISDAESRTADDYLIDSIEMPLAGGPMTIATRKLRSLS